MPTDRLVLRRPDDWHVHLRDGAMLKAVLPFTAHQFGRAIIMPNLKPPVTRTADAVAYRERILAALPEGHAFTPLMTAYLTDGTDADDLAQGFEDGVFAAAKLYPANATTNSAHGVTDLGKIAPVLERMAEIGMPLLIHGEVTDAHVDIFDREAVFLERTLGPLLERYAALRVVLEHATTAEAVAFVREHAASGRVGATITAHHLLINRSHLFAGGIRPHLYCLPIAKRETHRVALVEAATSGEGPFFLGTDTAPHTVTAKESACGCAGCFTAANAMELYAEAFDEAGALDKLEAFASLNGPRFYGLPVNEDKVVLERTPSTTPDIVLTADGEAVLPFRSGETTRWTFAGAA
ncbi:dihydroorotase [Azospirillum argentinense]|uniref:Dihydroorotase n=1 Tax=Azospirillum argentinense TaxID=2970906 RepID=A0A2K1FZI3_9PROT|nr:dihydroorotase [Azospirillum argentinense]AIB12524.1 dihydroorotase [Azospirillum argentinense]EZQ09327.1 dihydroorotase [Azospirillum argentinense]KAA1056461.1 Dihydroorotase [Azospirillum argentinense]MBK3803167.1 dihydroorotase [Azospirillum argentinense]PNQ97953.1 dihydroorotase [Azospirillum argentinense]